MTLNNDAIPNAQATSIIDTAWQTYAPKIDAKLTEIEQLILRDLGWTFSSGIYDLSDDEYEHRFFVAPDDTEEGRKLGVDVSITLGEARVFGDDPEHGVSFRLGIFGWGGSIVTQFAPYNYTDQCWVDARDEQALEERWLLMEEVDIQDVPGYIEGHVATLTDDVENQ